MVLTKMGEEKANYNGKVGNNNPQRVSPHESLWIPTIQFKIHLLPVIESKRSVIFSEKTCG